MTMRRFVLLLFLLSSSFAVPQSHSADACALQIMVYDGPDLVIVQPCVPKEDIGRVVAAFIVKDNTARQHQFEEILGRAKSVRFTIATGGK